MAKSVEEMRDEIIEALTTEFQKHPAFDPAVLEIKVDDAIEEVRECRHYENTNMSDEAIEVDLLRFARQIKNLARFDYHQIGAFGESYHYEGGTNRTWVAREKFLDGITAFAKLM